MPGTMYAANQELKINQERFPVLDALIDRLVSEKHKQYFIVRAHRYGVPIYEYAAGSHLKPYKLQQDSISPVFSCAKPITAVLMMKLQEDGEIDLCDSVYGYLPWLGKDKEEIKIWHLLTHTSGIIDEDFFRFSDEYCQTSFGLEKPAEEASREDWQAYRKSVLEKAGLPEDASREVQNHYFLERFTLTKKPREQMSYGMTAYNLLGDIITAVTGKNIDDYAKEVLFQPLHMTNSHFIVPEEKYAQVIERAEESTGYPWINSPDCMKNTCAQNGLKTTVVDLCRFGDMVLGKGTWNDTIILSPTSVREMSDNHNFDLPSSWDSWGLGWNLRGRKKDDAGILRSSISLEHGGWAGCKMLCDPMYGLSLSVFSGAWSLGRKNGVNNIINVIYSSIKV